METDTPTLRIRFENGRGYPIHFGPLHTLPNQLSGAGLRTGRSFIVTDENVAGHYLDEVTTLLREAGWQPESIVLPPGEATKSADNLQRIYDAALPWGLDRRTPVLALGGGVVGDLAGFAAATLLRGLPLVQLPTSLVAQVDSALGGKTGINHATGKNLIGAFWQPAFVLADPATLQTLPRREWTSGLAEVVKHAFIADPALVDFLEKHRNAVLNRDTNVVRMLLPRAARVKARIVSEDEHERGRRALLNFGHTFGHAIERVAGYGVFTHGEAVAVGMRAALHLSHTLHPELPLSRADRLVRMIPVADDLHTLPTEVLNEAMRFDKKTQAGVVRFILLRRFGEAYLTSEVEPKDVDAAWAFAKGA